MNQMETRASRLGWVSFFLLSAILGVGHTSIEASAESPARDRQFERYLRKLTQDFAEFSSDRKVVAQFISWNDFHACYYVIPTPSAPRSNQDPKTLHLLCMYFEYDFESTASRLRNSKLLNQNLINNRQLWEIPGNLHIWEYSVNARVPSQEARLENCRSAFLYLENQESGPVWFSITLGQEIRRLREDKHGKLLEISPPMQRDPQHRYRLIPLNHDGKLMAKLIRDRTRYSQTSQMPSGNYFTSCRRESLWLSNKPI